jgi:hypothetical protein
MRGIPYLPNKDWRRVYPAYVRPTRQVKFAGAVELFYPEIIFQFIENKDLRIGLGLANLVDPWGRRAEDPFRGLRAGPVCFSPFLFLRAPAEISYPNFSTSCGSKWRVFSEVLRAGDKR